MGKETLKDKIFRLIAKIGWKLFIIGIRMTEEEYWEQIKQQ